ncbi:unnamed protein product [Brugia pahangi]|uniref:Uncharacterized protein n=1 Tax=Brugia pahangi TaxID=6280 RepID=A0A0N4TWT1_BRUPA|nr:unnamed protein product [Brugia pahangi]
MGRRTGSVQLSFVSLCVNYFLSVPTENPIYWLSFDIESLIGIGRVRNGFSGISEETPETETAKEAVAIAINELPSVANTKVSTANLNFDRSLIKSEFLCDSTSSRKRPGASAVSATRTIDPESKCLGTAFHTYPCVSGGKSQCVPSSLSVSG